jgi:hypothetical protein
MPVLRPLTIALGVIWGVMMIAMLWQYPAVSQPVLWASLVFPIYYFGLSFWLQFARKSA